jgi:hypothetical protein
MATPGSSEVTGSFTERLKAALGEKSARGFALQCGLSPTAMHQYLTGKSEPTRPALISMARNAEVNLEWLLTGEGPQKKISGDCMLDRDLYDAIIESVDEWLDARKKSLPPAKKLETYHYLYDMFKDLTGVNKEQVDRTLRLVA